MTRLLDDGGPLSPSARRDEALLRMLLHDTQVSVTDTAGRIIEVNDDFCRLSGYSREELVGQPHSIVNSGVQDPEFWADLWRTIAAGGRWQGEICDRAKDGSLFWVDSTIAPLPGPDGGPTAYISTRREITARKRVEGGIQEESLRHATQRADHANRAKSQFLANMSHEIRTPMNAVVGLSYLLTQTQLNVEQRELLAKIQVSSQSLLAILNDVLDLTKIEAEELIVECEAFNPYSLLRGICDVVALQAQAKGIAFDIDLADDLPIVIKGDATRLSQILNNLLTNAVKFTERGGVCLRVTCLEQAPGGTTLRFVVHDTGIGISPDAQEHLFHPFSQADASITRRYGGTGLGLSIVKSLAALLGGDITLRSTPGVGSEFSVILKFATAGPESLAVARNYVDSPTGRVLARVRVLLVDDSDINLDVTRRILELHGAEVQSSSNGLEACERLRADPYEFDVVLMDVQMPLRDGYEATRYIRADLGLVDLPIIALTAGALSSERQHAFAAGMDDFIIKPFDAPTLTTSILRHVRTSVLQGATPTAALSLPPAPETIPWPEITGIDLTDARVRLCDDFDLFLSNLRRLLDEFADETVPAALEDPGAHTRYAARMHKLSGAAGMLGANAIQQLAVDARAACVAGDSKLGERLADALAVELRNLGDSAAPILQDARARADRAVRTAARRGTALRPEHVADLILSLRQQSLSARGRFDAISGELRSMLGEGKFEVLRDHVENLRFMEAATVLEESGSAGNAEARG